MADAVNDRYADFDAAFAEADAEPITMRLYGRVWSLPGNMPAGAVLKVTRLMAAGKAEHELTFAELLDLAADLIPRETLDVWCGKGLDAEQLAKVLAWLMRIYMGKDVEDGDGPGEAPAPDGALGSSSNDGGFSRPTSPATTSST